MSIEQERCLKGSRFGQMVVTIPKLQLEILVVEYQMKGKATKNAPHPQCHHLLGKCSQPFNYVQHTQSYLAVMRRCLTTHLADFKQYTSNGRVGDQLNFEFTKIFYRLFINSPNAIILGFKIVLTFKK